MTLSKQQARKRIRSLRSKAAANRRVTAPGYDGHAATEAMRAGFWAKYCDRVDPEQLLSEEERMERAKKLWQSDMLTAKANKLQRRLRSLKSE